MSTLLTSDQATAQLRDHPDAFRTPEALRSLAAQIDANAPGKLTVLYSGTTPKDVWSSHVIDLMNDPGERIRMINNRPAKRI